MDSTDMPIVNGEANVKKQLAKAQAALKTLRELQAGHNQLSSDPAAAFLHSKAALDQAEAALEWVSQAMNEMVSRCTQAEIARGEWEQRFRAITQDISRLKQQEDEIRQLNRTLKALSNSNQAMLHAEDETGFLNLACRIIVEDCGFAMVWIGFAQNDRRKSVRPVASAGFEQGYLDNLNITWADTERGRGPTGTAIRTKKPSRCNNMLTDPKFAPWREAAIKNGYASSLVLPLLSGGRAFGALNIYSREPNGFSDEEEKLLIELAGDLAYGIMTLRLKADQARSSDAIRLSEQRYRTLFNNTSDGVCIYNLDGEILEANEAYCQMSGYTCDELTHTQVAALEARGTSEEVSSRIQKLLDQKGHDRYETQHHRKDGTIFDVDITALYFEQDGGRIANFVRDITERKRAEQRLAYLASFPEVNPRPITEVDIHGAIQYANPTAMKLFPDLKERGISHPWLVDWDSVTRQIQDGQMEVTFRDVAIGDRYYQQSLNYISPQGLVRIYGLDITEHKLAEQALRQAHDELEHKVLERTQELNIANEQLRAKIIEHQKAQNELESNMQELQVIEEELRNNNEMMIDAQKVLDTERQRYQDLFDFAPDGYLVTDGNGLILEANQFATQLLGIPYHSVIGKPLLVFISPGDHNSFHHLLSTLKLQHTVQSQELTLLPRKGPELSVAITIAAAKDPSEEDTLRWTLRDITERKRAEEIIRQNSRRNAVMSEVSQLLADASLDEHAILEIVAKSAARSIGDGCVINLAAEDGHGLNTVAWHHIQPEILELMDSLLTSGQFQTADGLSRRVYESSMPILIQNMDAVVLDLIREDIRSYVKQVDITSLLIVPLQIAKKTVGTISLVRSRGSLPFTDDDQALLEILASRTAQTIHNARLYQELQNALKKELETHDQLVQAEKFAAVGRLLASITHEINNPLQTIKNCLYLSQMDTTPGTPAYDALAMATTETNRLSNLVAQLREIYRPPTHGQSRPVQLPALLNEVHTLLAGYLQEKHVKWVLARPNTGLLKGVVIEGVADQLKQVFLNICINAVDAMEPDGGTITISFDRSAEENKLGICIRDSGPGLTQAVKDKLFEPFTTTKEKGLGLGLVICYDIMQKHNGSIDVESKPGEGAAFTLWLPVKRQED